MNNQRTQHNSVLFCFVYVSRTLLSSYISSIKQYSGDLIPLKNYMFMWKYIDFLSLNFFPKIYCDIQIFFKFKGQITYFTKHMF